MIGLLKLALQAKHIVKVIPIVKAIAGKANDIVPVVKAVADGQDELGKLFADAVNAWDTDKDGKPDVTPEEIAELVGRALVIVSKHMKK